MFSLVLLPALIEQLSPQLISHKNGCLHCLPGPRFLFFFSHAVSVSVILVSVTGLCFVIIRASVVCNLVCVCVCVCR